MLLGGKDVTQRAPYERDVNTVFQDYALFPHMTVQENVEYGLRVKRVAKAERRERAVEALALVRLGAFAGAQAEPALGRTAAARRARARARQPARRPAARRAARSARSQAAPGDADRAQAHPADGRDHVRLRHARPGGGALDERPAGRLQPGPHRAGRQPGGGLRAARHRVRRQLRRHLERARRRARRAAREAPARGTRVCPAGGRGDAARDDRGRRLPRADHALRRPARGRLGARRTSAEPRADVYGGTGRPGAPGTGRLARRSRRRHRDATGTEENG